MGKTIQRREYPCDYHSPTNDKRCKKTIELTDRQRRRILRHTYGHVYCVKHAEEEIQGKRRVARTLMPGYINPKQLTEGRLYDIKYDFRRNQGCIVTFEHKETGDLRTCHHYGDAEEVLAEICRKARPGEFVASISTIRSIARDIKYNRLRDPFVVEKTLLGRVGRLDLLDPRAIMKDTARLREKRIKDLEALGLS
jgi:hypothetical protein